ncbi:MAG: helix-turn-helix transcriptional regulator [Bacteroidaceae bacterium]|nr:helix-turn-helix transcriptional regulator [Bacteroidaceae bacterium]
MKKIKKRSDCPISCSLDIWGDKWSLLIIRDLMFSKKCRYTDFLKSAEGIATNILVTKLQALEENKIIEKLDDPESKSKGYYKLTQIGVDLLPILIEIGLWSEKYFPITEEIKTILIEVKKDKAKFINKTIAELTNN